MTEFNLTEIPPLGSYVRSVGGVTLSEVTDLNILSVATPLGGAAALEKEFKKLGLTLVGPGHSMNAKGLRVIGMAADQHFLLSQGDSAPAVKAAYTTDQTHNWVAIRAEGAAIWAALERLCMLDLHPDAFTVDGALRFDIETMVALMVKEDENQVLLLGAASSAQSSLHAIETALIAVA
ncbi:MAG: hypothetical protein AAGA63_14185 [Pseudomonadota bacterium]